MKVDPAGKVSDFATAPDMAAIFGVKIDAQKKFLWACSSPIAEMENFDAAMPSKVFKYELSTGKPAGSFDAPSDVKILFLVIWSFQRRMKFLFQTV